MAKNTIMPPEDVSQYLDNVKKRIDIDDAWQINNQPWANGKENKTRTYMAETGITSDDIKQVVKELSLKNYCYTRDDSNIRFPNEQIWVFGITKSMIDQEEDLYIKLKIRTLDTELLI